MFRRLAALAIFIMGIATIAVRADDFWLKKDWKEWSKEDCKKILHDSPWTRKWKLEIVNNMGHLPSVTSGVQMNGNSGTGQPNTDVGAEGNAIVYYLQLRSSTPVRDAMIREKQIEKKYDKMSEADKKTFDAQMDQMMKGSDDIIAVHVVFETMNRRFSDSLTKYWSSLPPDAVPEGVYLIADSGTPVAPLTFTPPKNSNEFDMTFPRMANGHPLIPADAKSVKIEFPHPAIGDYPAQNAVIDFKTDKMAWDGKLSF